MSEAIRLENLGRPTGFRSSARYAQLEDTAPPPPPEPEGPPDDPVAIAYAEGFAAGIDAMRLEAEEHAQIEAAAREALALSFARLDQDLQEELRMRLRDTVAVLCESAIAPLALDEKALMQRIEAAVSMLARADDERLIRLHPDDIAMIAPQMGMDWQIVPDSTLERGSLRVESVNGGIEDGPAVWRRAIAEALHQC